MTTSNLLRMLILIVLVLFVVFVGRFVYLTKFVRKRQQIKVAFIHPDLGIGGAEQLVVNAALALQSKGYDILIFTAHHDPSHCFDEVKPTGGLGKRVHCHGNWIPASILGKAFALCAVLRMYWISLIIFSFYSPNIIFLDQVSAVCPLLKFTNAKILFYCHYPDKLLCVDRKSAFKQAYRFVLDWIEEKTTGMADMVVVNSKFTQKVFFESFPSLKIKPKVLYPVVDIYAMEEHLKKVDSSLDNIRTNWFNPEDVLIVSINRFERKKDIGLAVRTLYEILQIETKNTRTKLVIAGGCDPENRENVEHLEELKSLVNSLDLTDHVVFLPSFSNAERAFLLSKCRCVVYTPQNEHFGIVPIEAMVAKRPVVAVCSGGPMESILHQKTGYLCDPSPRAFADAILQVLRDSKLAEEMGQYGYERVKQLFSLDVFTSQIDIMCQELLGYSVSQ